MTYIEFLDKTREKISETINDFLTDKYGLEPIRYFVKNGFDVVDRPQSLAIYGASPSSSVYQQGNKAITSQITVEFFLNDSADGISVGQIEEYFSAIAEYLTKETFGEYSTLSRADIHRMDMGSDCNEALFLIDAKIQGTSDMYFYK